MLYKVVSIKGTMEAVPSQKTRFVLMTLGENSLTAKCINVD